MVVAPLVLLGGGVGSRAAQSAAVAVPTAPAKAPSPSSVNRSVTLRDIQLSNNRILDPTTTTTTTAPPPTTTAPRPVYVAPRPVYVAPPTTAPPVRSTAQGIATWYYWNPGECASPWLPHGTRVTVTNQANGASTTCTVTDTEAAGGDRVIDLDASVFNAIAGPGGTGVGTLVVTLSW